MPGNDMTDLHRRWPKFTPEVLRLLQKREGAKGLLFISHDDSGDEDAPLLAAYLGDGVITHTNETKSEWREKMTPLRARRMQKELFEEGTKYICVLVHELDRKPQWMWGELKACFERPARPWVCLATTTKPKKIPRWLTSHFFECRKTGIPRKMS